MARGWDTSSVCKICGAEIEEGAEYCTNCIKTQSSSQGNNNIGFWEEIPPILYIFSWTILVLPLSICFILLDCSFITRIIIYAVNILIIIGFIGSIKAHKSSIHNTREEAIQKAEAENREMEREREAIEELGKKVAQCKPVDIDMKTFIPSEIEENAICPVCKCTINGLKIICPSCRPKLAKLVHEVDQIGKEIVYCNKCDKYYVDLSECPVCESKVSVVEDIVTDITDYLFEKEYNGGLEKTDELYKDAVAPINDTIAKFPTLFKEIQENYEQYTEAFAESQRLYDEFIKHKTAENQLAGLKANGRAAELLISRAEALKKQHLLESALEELPISTQKVQHATEEAYKNLHSLFITHLEKAREQVPESMRIYQYILDHQSEIKEYIVIANERKTRIEG